MSDTFQLFFSFSKTTAQYDLTNPYGLVDRKSYTFLYYERAQFPIITILLLSPNFPSLLLQIYTPFSLDAHTHCGQLWTSFTSSFPIGYSKQYNKSVRQQFGRGRSKQLALSFILPRRQSLLKELQFGIISFLQGGQLGLTHWVLLESRRYEDFLLQLSSVNSTSNPNFTRRLFPHFHIPIFVHCFVVLMLIETLLVYQKKNSLLSLLGIIVFIIGLGGFIRYYFVFVSIICLVHYRMPIIRLIKLQRKWMAIVIVITLSLCVLQAINNSFITYTYLMFHTLQSFLNWPQIKQQLQQLAERKYSPQEIITLISNFQYYSHCDQNRPQQNASYSKCRLLLKLYDKQLPQIFSKVASFVLSRTKHSIPLFLQGEEKEHTFTKETVLYLFCSMMLCLTPKQEFDSSISLRNNFNYLLDFSYIFDEQQFKTRNVIEYIKKQIDNKQAYDEKMTVHRHVQERPIQQIIQENKNRPMGKVTVESDQASIQNFYGELKADFANKYLGGGALLSGCVQEELMFANHPQLFTTQLLCEVMKPNECIFLSGYKKYFNNSGYGWTAAFDGPNKHQYKYDTNKQAEEYITAIDAIHFGRRNEWEQFEPFSINRQLLKAYCGFSFGKSKSNRVVTGNWGCGAFGGNLKIKFLIQWIACSALGKQMVYCPFGSRDKVYVQPFLQKFSILKVGEAYSLVHKACDRLVKQKSHMDIYKVIEELL